MGARSWDQRGGGELRRHLGEVFRKQAEQKESRDGNLHGRDRHDRIPNFVRALVLLVVVSSPTILLVAILCMVAAEVQQIVLTTPIPLRHR